MGGFRAQTATRALRLVGSDETPPLEPASSEIPPALLGPLLEGIGTPSGGEVIVRGGEHQGRIYIFSGRIAWVRSSTVQTRLRDVLARSAGISDRALDDAIQFTQQNGQNFAETLIERNLIDPPHLRTCLLEHNADHFRGLVRFADNGQAMFIPQSRKYRGNLLYGLDELMSAAFRVKTTPAVEAATQNLLSVVPQSTHAAALHAAGSCVCVSSAKTDLPRPTPAMSAERFWESLAPLIGPRMLFPAQTASKPTEVVVHDDDQALLVVRSSRALTAAVRCADISNFGLSLGLARTSLRELEERFFG